MAAVIRDSRGGGQEGVHGLWRVEAGGREGYSWNAQALHALLWHWMYSEGWGEKLTGEFILSYHTEHMELTG